MRSATLPDGGRIRWLDLPGDGTGGAPVVYVHGLGAASGPHFTEIATSPTLVRRRSLLVDLVGFGCSDRPAAFGYALGDHAAAVALALDAAAVGGVDLVGHSLGGTVAIALASARPDLVRRLVVIEPNLDPWDGGASVAIARQTEDEFVRTGFDALVLEASPEWAATLRWADPLAVHRTAVALCEMRGGAARDLLQNLPIHRTLVWGGRSVPPAGLDGLLASGVVHRVVPGAAHVPMEDAPDALATVLVDRLEERPSAATC